MDLAGGAVIGEDGDWKGLCEEGPGRRAVIEWEETQRDEAGPGGVAVRRELGCQRRD